jgi:1-acyl-sn-glycerol-3-phosphate acyltransferase
MSHAERIQWMRQWVPFGLRTIAYGSVSLTLGPVTPQYAASLWAMKAWCRSSLEALRIDCEVEGTEHVPSSGGFMYASNHQSLLDILVLGAALPGDFKWATKRSIMNVPFLGWHLRVSGHVPVDRTGGRKAAVEAIKRFRTVLEEGKPLLIFPEGTRTRDGDIQPFKNGGFYAAVRAHVPVLPVALEGTYGLMSKDDVDSGSTHALGQDERRVRVRIGAPLRADAEGKEGTQVADLRQRTRDAVLELHSGLRPAPR